GGVVEHLERRGVVLERRHDVRAGRPEHARPRAGRADDGAGPEPAHHRVPVGVRGVVEREEDVVLGRGRVRAELRADARDAPEEPGHRVHEVRPHVEEEAAADGVVLLPALLRHRAPALPAPLERVHATEVAALQHGLQRELLRVPAAVLEHRERRARLLGRRDDRAGLRRAERERLVHDDGRARARERGRVVGVQGGRARDHDDVVRVAVGDEAREVVVQTRAGPVLDGGLAALGRADHDGRDLVPGLAHEARVDPAPRSPVPDDPDPERACGAVHGDQSSRASRRRREAPRRGRSTLSDLAECRRWSGMDRCVPSRTGRAENRFREGRPLSTTSRRVPRRSVLRYVLIALAFAIVVANVVNQQSVAADDAPAPSPGGALEALARLEVKGPGPDTGYERALFGPAWADVDGNGCDTRNDLLTRDLTDITYSTRGDVCEVRTGTFQDPYTGETIDFRRGNATSMAVQIDHVVPLLDAWRKGARTWDD